MSKLPNTKIEGGFYIKARVIKEKKIANAAPHVREIWDYFLREANFKPNKYKSFSIERGQLFRSYQDIREALHWNIGWRKMMYSENQMKNAMKFLREHLMITTERKPGGVLVTVVNYDFYQTASNYEKTDDYPTDYPIEKLSENYCRPPNNKKEKKVKNNKKEKKIYLEDSDEFRVANFLYKNILKNIPHYKKPNIQKWADDARKMIKYDKRDLKTIKKLIVWCQNTEFTMTNILSISKLRLRFDELILRMNIDNKKHQPNPEPTLSPDAIIVKGIDITQPWHIPKHKDHDLNILVGVSSRDHYLSDEEKADIYQVIANAENGLPYLEDLERWRDKIETEKNEFEEKHGYRPG